MTSLRTKVASLSPVTTITNIRKKGRTIWIQMTRLMARNSKMRPMSNSMGRVTTMKTTMQISNTMRGITMITTSSNTKVMIRMGRIKITITITTMSRMMVDMSMSPTQQTNK
jgi:hypothetical protein